MIASYVIEWNSLDDKSEVNKTIVKLHANLLSRKLLPLSDVKKIEIKSYGNAILTTRNEQIFYYERSPDNNDRFVELEK